MSIYERTKEVPASIDIFQRLFLPNQAAGSLVSFLRAGAFRTLTHIRASTYLPSQSSYCDMSLMSP